MKKGLLAGLTVALVAIVVSGAFAFGPGYGQGPCADIGACPMVGNATPEQAQKFAKFQGDILPLKQKMLQLRTELMNLRSQTSVDWKTVAAKQKEMVDVRTSIQQKASESGITGMGVGGCGMGRMGMGMGRMGRL